MAEQETDTSQQLKSITETEKPKDDTNSFHVVNQDNNSVKKDLDDNISKQAAPTNEESKDDTGELTAPADVKREDLTEKKAPDTTSSPALDQVNADQLDGSPGGPEVHPHQDQDEPKDDANSLHVVNQENNTVKKDLDDNITKPAAATNEENKDDFNEPANKDPTVLDDDKREDLTEKKAPDTTSPHALEAVNSNKSDGSSGGPCVHPHQDQDEPKDDANSLHVVNQENNNVKKDLDDNISKPAAPTNEETKDDTGELTTPADVKREDLTEKKAPDTTSSPALDPVNADQLDGSRGGPDVHLHRDEDIKHEAAGDHERSPEQDSPELEMLDTKDAEEEMPNKRMPVETIKSVSLESVERTATDYTGFLRRNRLLLIAVAVVVVAALLAPRLMPSSPSETPRDESKVDVFLRKMEGVKAQFLNQRAELWKRSRIHLRRHLQTAHPTAPVSLILTAGLRAEKTMRCLAQGLASSLSYALNASILHINGSSTASQDSDQVKLDIDRKLQNAFEGDKPVAIIHRFEELPPGSTLIFYRYCDHENAAYKDTFLIFTVLLEEEEEIPAKMHLNAVEEMVDDHLKKKFLSHDHPVSFDRMDIDKYGGLWSRISHLILPVAAEPRIEHEGCRG